jgi:elongation factor 1-beta
MATVVVTLKVMPESPETDLDELTKKVSHIVKTHHGDVGKVETEPLAFGLKALKIIFVRDEKLGSVDDIADEVAEFEEVASAEVSDVRRAIG